MNRTPTTAVVFAYHNVGVRALSVLLALGIRVPLVITHQDDPHENQWFDSVAALADREGIPTQMPEDPNQPVVIQAVQDCQADFIFSFYYRHLLGVELLALPRRGAYNLHGSLLPHYRGRVPINWAVCHGESQTGVSLHVMERRADAGALLDQEAVAILPNDTAHAVFQKAVCASERLLLRTLPPLLAGQLTPTPMDLSQGSYFGRRRPEDGRIDWRHSAWQIHNLIRAVAPPYPGAFFDLHGERIRVLGSHYRNEAARTPPESWPCIYQEGERCYADCQDGKRLQLLHTTRQGQGPESTASCHPGWGRDALLAIPTPPTA
ncbi:MAG: formyltransferase [Magnetococcales bacterium]|nr:formyltransferase [Magnetococcales bacterium]